jgi:CRP-like cAMP-binding protein
MHGTEPTLALIHEGEVVGELGVLDDLLRSASIAALRRSEIVEVPASSFRSAYHSDPAIPRQMVTMLAARLRTVTDGLADLAYLDLGGRLAKYLLGESERQSATTITLGLTQSELGQMLGGARQTVNQVMRSLEDAGLVVIAGRTVQIIDERGLRLRSTSAGGRFE